MQPDDTAANLLAGLTNSQREAVTSDAAPLCVMACAGAGKTRVLTRRIAYRVMTGRADARHTLALTFTRKAAGELQGRLRELGLREEVAAGTFHSFALAQLRRWWADRRQPEPVLLERKSRLLAPLAAERPGLSTMAVSDIAGHVEWAKSRLVAPEDFAAVATASGRVMPPGVPASAIAALYGRYEDEKVRRGLVDFDDLLGLCADALELEPVFAAAQRWRWRHLLVDEFQDVAPLQHRLLLGWLGQSTDLCVVGDPHQAVYGWNGADPELLLQVPHRWPGTEVLYLDDNHRCSPQVVSAAAAVLGESGSHLRSAAADGPDPTARAYPSELAEAAGIASELGQAHASGQPWGSMAVLTRTNAQLQPIHAALTAAGIPVWAPAPPRSSPDEPAAAAPWTEDEQPARSRGEDRVTICSFHRSKGLEWHSVWVAGLEQGFVPIGRATTDAEEAEERRLLYVALSRASVELRCSWARQRTFGARTVPREASPWLESIRLASAFGSPAEVADAGEWRARIAVQRRLLVGGGSGAARRGRERSRVALPASMPKPDDDLVRVLRSWRADMARASGVPAIAILHDITLAAIASLRPRSTDELLAVPGLGPVKAGRYGPTILSLLADRVEAS